MNLLRFVAENSPNIQATLIQAMGLWLFGLLLVVLARPVDREWFTDFAKSFVFMAVAVTSLRVAFTLGSVQGFWFLFVYFLGEYLFLHFLVRGTRGLAGQPPKEPTAPLLLVALVAALVLSSVQDFSRAFVAQAAIMTIGLLVAFGFAMKKPVRTLPGVGIHLLRFSLLVLAVGFAQYVPVLGIVVLEGRELPAVYSTFMPVFDLIFESALAFAMIVVGMESVQLQLTAANAHLEEARGRLDHLARTDPLTELMNRHAFAAVLESPQEGASGTLAVIDLDGLKAINDTHGHLAGDQAIRAFAGALRSKLRADDLIFRWGGDEFLAVMFGLPPTETTERLSSIGMVEVRLDGERRVQVSASYGVAAFSSIGDLRAAAEAADALMYQAKRGRGRQAQVS